MIESYSQQVRYKEPLLLFHHDGTKLSNVSAQAGPVFQKTFPARGLAVGDYDNDGRLDVLIGNNGEAPVLLKNNAGDGQSLARREAAGHGLQPRRDRRDDHLVGRRHEAQPLQDRAAAATSRRTTCARCSASARAAKLDWLEIKWPQPSGRVERFTDLPIDRYVTIVEGKGKVD